MKYSICKFCRKSIKNQTSTFLCSSCAALSKHWGDWEISVLLSYSKQKQLSKADLLRLAQIRNPRYDMNNKVSRGALVKTLRNLGYSGKTERWPELKQDSVNLGARAQKLVASSCEKCGKKEKLNVHHVIPISWGGNNESNNLITLCFACHRAEHRFLQQWIVLFTKTNYDIIVNQLRNHELSPTAYNR